jgi:hypothetical protein
MRVATVQDGAPIRWEYVDMRIIKTTATGFGGAGEIVRMTEYARATPLTAP